MLGEQLMQMRRSRDALPYLERAAALMPSGPRVALLSIAYAENGNADAAIQSAALAARNADESGLTYVRAGRAMRLIHRTADAETYLGQARLGPARRKLGRSWDPLHVDRSRRQMVPSNAVRTLAGHTFWIRQTAWNGTNGLPFASARRTYHRIAF
jgi:hypothetical protein